MAPKRPRPKRTRVTVDLGDELTRRLRVHGLQTGRSDSAVVRELVERYVPRYRVQTLGVQHGVQHDGGDSSSDQRGPAVGQSSRAQITRLSSSARPDGEKGSTEADGESSEAA